MEVYLYKDSANFVAYECEDWCPYCGKMVYFDWTSDSDGIPEEAECPHCGEVVRLLIEFEPVIALLRRIEE